jgi:hypothetical protein
MADKHYLGAEIQQQLLDWFVAEVEAGNICNECGGPPSAPIGDCAEPYHATIPPLPQPRKDQGDEQ